MTDDVRDMVNGLKGEIESKAGATYASFTPVKYATQVVAGTNYFVKVDVGNGSFVHVRIFKSLPNANQPPSVHSVQTGKTAGDHLDHF